MIKQIIIFGWMILLGTSVFSQSELDAYKYVISSKRFDFQKSEDSHQMNSLLKFLFEKQGFTVFYNDDKFPEDLRQNPCLALNVKLVDHSSLLKTKVLIELYNCQNKLVLKTPLTETREKDLKKGYHETIRKAFETIENKRYKFSNEAIINNNKGKSEEQNTVKIPEQLKTEIIVVEEIISEVPQKGIIEEKKYQDKVPVIAEIPKETKFWNIEGVFSSSKQKISINKQGNQFVVTDEQNNVIGILYATYKPSYFIIKWLQSDNNQPRLVFLNDTGDLIIDGNQTTTMLYKRKSE